MEINVEEREEVLNDVQPEPDTQVQPNITAAVPQVETCPVCNEGIDQLEHDTETKDNKWVGCDTCDRWIHRMCLEPYDRAKADASLMLQIEQACMYCQMPSCNICQQSLQEIDISCDNYHATYHKKCLRAKEHRKLSYQLARGMPWMCSNCFAEYFQVLFR